MGLVAQNHPAGSLFFFPGQIGPAGVFWLTNVNFHKLLDRFGNVVPVSISYNGKTPLDDCTALAYRTPACERVERANGESESARGAGLGTGVAEHREQVTTRPSKDPPTA